MNRLPVVLLALAACAPDPLAGHRQGVCALDGRKIPVAVDLTAVSELQSAGEGTFRLPEESLPVESAAGPAIFAARDDGYGENPSVGLVVQDDESEGELWALLGWRNEAWVGECGFAQYGTLKDGLWGEEDIVWSGSADTVESFADDAILEGELRLTRATEDLPAAEGDPFEPDACELERDEADVCLDVTVRGNGKESYRHIEFHDEDGRLTAYAEGGGTGDWEIAGFYAWSDSGKTAKIDSDRCEGGADFEEEWEFDDDGYESSYAWREAYDTLRCSITTEVVDGTRVSASWRCSRTCMFSSGEGPYRFDEERTYGSMGRLESVEHSGKSCWGEEDDYTESYSWDEC